MKYNTQIVLVGCSLIVFLCCLSSAASLSEVKQSKIKRSPYLRLDELSTKIYLAKNKLGGGMIDPLEIGKRSEDSYNNAVDNSEIQLAVILYDGLSECINRENCSKALKLLLDN
ncbi:hypothetical protein BpHYR1_045266 [Brachionus plicatilis]|uniref:Uncharacterized protein n=1 Tax=Brachionus plicatilis TaxID=10195 RepID=A0A3M7QTT5_BRAPC|nr:hypothetical protein BpHYR1_045266 [Brachionus plicatilis]